MINLKKLRKERNLSQKQFAEIFHSSQNTVSQWENGTREPSIKAIQDIAKFFGVTTDYLLGNDDTPQQDEKSKSADDELAENVVIYSRNGETIRKSFTKEEMKVISTMLESLKGTQYNDDL